MYKSMSSPTTFRMWILLTLIVTAVCDRPKDKEYVDPTNMLEFDPVNVRMKNEETERVIPEENIKGKQDGTQDDTDISNKKDFCNKSEEMCAHMKKSFEKLNKLQRQYVRMLVNHLEAKVGQASEPVQLNLRLQISFHHLSKLQLYGQDESSADVNDVYEILNFMVQYASDIIPPETKIHWLESRMGLSVPVLTQILGILLVVLFMLKTVPTIRITRRLLLNVIFWAFIVSVIFNWMEMHQKEVADQERKLMERMKESCPNSEDMSWLNRVSSYIFSSFTFKEDKCQEFYHAMLVNPIVKVTPMEAVANSVVKTLVAPLGIIGTGIKTFLVALLKDLPVQYQLWVFIILAIVVLVTPFLARGYGFNLFHMINITPAYQPQYLAGGPAYQPLPGPRPGHQPLPEHHGSAHSQQQLPANQTRPLTYSQSEGQLDLANRDDNTPSSSELPVERRHREPTRDTSCGCESRDSSIMQGNTAGKNIPRDSLAGGDAGLQSDKINSSTDLSTGIPSKGDHNCKELCDQVSDLKISDGEVTNPSESVDSVANVSKEIKKMTISAACSEEEKADKDINNDTPESKDLMSEKEVSNESRATNSDDEISEKSPAETEKKN